MPKTHRLPSAIVPSDFAARLKILRDLQQDARDAFRVASGAILNFAVEYESLYRDVARNGELVTRLNDALGLTYDASNRLRGIAAQAKQLKSIQRYLPPSPESIYEISRGLKKNGKQIWKAIETQQLTPQSTLRDIRNIRSSGKLTDPDSSKQVAQKVRKLPKVPVHELKFIHITVEVPLRHVPAWHQVVDLRESVVRRLAEHHARYVEMGHRDQSPRAETMLKAYLDTYALLNAQMKTVKAAKQTAEQAAKLRDLEKQWAATFE